MHDLLPFLRRSWLYADVEGWHFSLLLSWGDSGRAIYQPRLSSDLYMKSKRCSYWCDVVFVMIQALASWSGCEMCVSSVFRHGMDDYTCLTSVLHRVYQGSIFACRVNKGGEWYLTAPVFLEVIYELINPLPIIRSCSVLQVTGLRISVLHLVILCSASVSKLPKSKSRR